MSEEKISRRRLMTRTANAAGAIAGAAIALPALGFALGPVFDRVADSWQDIGPLPRFGDSDYVPVVITLTPGVGVASKSLAYVRRHTERVDGPAKDRYDHVIAISSRCAHVGCPVRFVSAARSFVCPCHGGVYDSAESGLAGRHRVR
jgi:Rieske Fe-S protein